MGAKSSKEWFTVDKNGLGQALAGRGIEFAIGELLQNAWDADGVRTVRVTLEPISHSPSARLSVEDDSPGGFADLTHTYRLFGGSTKRHDRMKRGKFDLGEKLVFACAREATVESTTGTVRFDAKGRHVNRKACRIVGSRVEAILPMTRDELDRSATFVRRVLPPDGIRTYFNGELLTAPIPLLTVKAHLETETADDSGRMKRRYETCDVRVHHVRDDEKAMIFEMGLPIQETGDTYHYDVQQRVPVGFDRDSVSTYYLNTVRTAVLGQLAEAVPEAEADWVTQAVGTGNVAPQAVKTIIQRRFGTKAVAADPTDQEAVHKATANGYTVVHGGSLPAPVWEQVRKLDLLPRAGRIFPTNPDKAGEAEVIPEPEWTRPMRRLAAYARQLGTKLLEFEPVVRFVRHENGSYRATWSKLSTGTLTFNMAVLGDAWLDDCKLTDDNIALVIHEFGHHYESNHLSEGYYRALSLLGAKMRNCCGLEWNC